MDQDTVDIISSQTLIHDLLQLKDKKEVLNKLSEKGVVLTNEEFSQYIQTILKIIQKTSEGTIVNGKISDEVLANISASGVYDAVRGVGQVISFPFRAVSYAVGSIVAGVPKGFIDGVYDSWTNWEKNSDNNKTDNVKTTS